jgi:hypothetical protein
MFTSSRVIEGSETKQQSTSRSLYVIWVPEKMGVWKGVDVWGCKVWVWMGLRGVDVLAW